MPSIQPTQGFTTFPAGSTPTLSATGIAQDYGCAVVSSMLIVIATGTVTAGSFQMQGSYDGVNWFSFGPTVTAVTNASATGSLGGTPIRFARGICTAALTGGATVLVQMASS